MNAPTGRWQKGKDLSWYAKDDAGKAKMVSDIAAVKQMEEDAMNAALGIKPKVRLTSKLDDSEMKKLFAKGEITHDDGERVEGLGAAPILTGRYSNHSSVLAGTYDAKEGVLESHGIDRKDVDEDREDRKRRKKEKKREKKAEKKAKKAEKKSKKEKDGEKRKRYSSDDDSSSEGESGGKRKRRSSDDDSSTERGHKRRRHDSDED